MARHISNKAISLAKIKMMFKEISLQTDWDLKQPMLWGYFFTHGSPKPLEKAKAKLVKQGYRFVNIYLSDKKKKSDPDMWWLHVEKEEVHTPQSLDKRDDELYVFADENGLDTYDGFDVGPIEKSKKPPARQKK